MNKGYSLLQLMIITAFIGICASMVIGIYKSTENMVCKTGTVKSVGGCDKYGECGVLLDNGLAGTAKFPIVGVNAQVCYWETKR